MSTLIVQLPAQPRLSAQASEPRLAPTEAAEWAYVLSTDGVHATRQGLCAPADLPRAQTTVAVLAPADVAWHRVTAPKAPAARLRAALAGLLEEALLDDDADLHLAIVEQRVVGGAVVGATQRCSEDVGHEHAASLAEPSLTPGGTRSGTGRVGRGTAAMYR